MMPSSFNQVFEDISTLMAMSMNFQVFLSHKHGSKLFCLIYWFIMVMDNLELLLASTFIK
jgi:hypothetical protein